ncbi:peptidylprolyl isomerase [Undibacterium arcticum]
MGGNEYKARHILVEKGSRGQGHHRQAEKKTQKNLRSPSQRKKSKDPGSKVNGGDLGWFDPRRMVPEFGAAVAKLEKGKFTEEPVKSQFGYHIILLEDSRMKEAPPFEQIKPGLIQKKRGSKACRSSWMRPRPRQKNRDRAGTSCRSGASSPSLESGNQGKVSGRYQEIIPSVLTELWCQPIRPWIDDPRAYFSEGFTVESGCGAVVQCTPFPHPSHRTGRADFPHPALGQDPTPSPTPDCALARSGVRVRSTRKGARVDTSHPCVA